VEGFGPLGFTSFTPVLPGLAVFWHAIGSTVALGLPGSIVAPAGRRVFTKLPSSAETACLLTKSVEVGLNFPLPFTRLILLFRPASVLHFPLRAIERDPSNDVPLLSIAPRLVAHVHTSMVAGTDYQ